MSLCLERWQDSRLKQERTINPQSIQSQLRTNSVHSAQGLQQLRADSDHPKGVFFCQGKLRSTDVERTQLVVQLLQQATYAFEGWVPGFGKIQVSISLADSSRLYEGFMIFYPQYSPVSKSLLGWFFVLVQLGLMDVTEYNHRDNQSWE